MERSLYDVLEISKKSTTNEIKRAYAQMLRKYPPEKFNREFSIINAAYEMLMNEEKRYEYDQLNGYPKNSQVMLDEGLDLIDNGEIEDGRERLKSFLSLEGDVPYALNEIAKTYEIEENYEKALEYQKRLIDKSKFITFEQIESFIKYLYKVGDEDNLNLYMKKSIMRFKNMETYFNLINYYIEDKKFNKAKELIEKKVIPALERRGTYNDYCEFSKLLFKMQENTEARRYVVKAIEAEVEHGKEIEEKLDFVKETVINELDFKSAESLLVVLDKNLDYIERAKEKLDLEVYKENSGWTIITRKLVKDIAMLDKDSIHKTLEKFLLASVKKRIAIHESVHREMGEILIESLEALRNEYDIERIKNNLIILERFHPDLYNVDAKYLFDKYGGFIPYTAQAKNKKKKEIERLGTKKKEKEKREKRE